MRAGREWVVSEAVDELAGSGLTVGTWVLVGAVALAGRDVGREAAIDAVAAVLARGVVKL